MEKFYEDDIYANEHNETYDDEFTEPEFDCGFIRWEGCTMAGSEDCDFECPWSDHLHAQMKRIQTRRENAKAKQAK